MNPTDLPYPKKQMTSEETDSAGVVDSRRKKRASAKNLKRGNVAIFVSTTAVAVFTSFVAATPNGTWPAAWANFFGAAFVALGGLIGGLHAASVVSTRWVPWSWACIVVGGFVIAGACLQMAMPPS